MAEPVGAVGTGVVLTILTTLAGAVLGWGFKVLRDEINDVEDGAADAAYERRVEDLEEAHSETRRLAEAAYTSVHGDEDRPEDIGFIVEAKERRQQLEDDVAELRESVARVERLQRDHNERVREAFRVLDNNIDETVPKPKPPEGDD